MWSSRALLYKPTHAVQDERERQQDKRDRRGSVGRAALDLSKDEHWGGERFVRDVSRHHHDRAKLPQRPRKRTNRPRKRCRRDPRQDHPVKNTQRTGT